MAWTDERIAMLKTHWEEGRSASQIAELMGENLSRNAVIGKAHRLGLASRPSPLKTSDAKANDLKPSESKAGDSKAGDATMVDPAPEAPAATARPRAARQASASIDPQPAQGTAMPANGPAYGPADGAAEKAAVARPSAPAAEPAAPRASRTSSKVLAKDTKVTLLDLNDRICKWPIGHPDEAGFHFCGKPVSPGFPYCGEHCLLAYQAQMPRRDRPAGPSRPFGPNLPRPR